MRASSTRSVIFFHSPEQEAAARASKEARDGPASIATRSSTAIEPASTFYRAEEYHQQFLARSGQSFCHTPGSW
jgi:peptide-methionine (S)-S-oxide reductase